MFAARKAFRKGGGSGECKLRKRQILLEVGEERQAWGEERKHSQQGKGNKKDRGPFIAVGKTNGKTRKSLFGMGGEKQHGKGEKNGQGRKKVGSRCTEKKIQHRKVGKL